MPGRPERVPGPATPYPLRRHQREALAALAAARAGGRRRAWVVLPPGAGKTLVGLETVRRELAAEPRLRAVVLSPNTAIQGQWLSGWHAFGATDELEASGERELPTAVTALTYQSVAVFAENDNGSESDGDDGDDERGARSPGGGSSSPLDRLHPNGRALVRRLQQAGPLLLVLDECHHLLDVWGDLLAEMLDSLPQARVLGLTATPATTLGPDQAALVDRLFGAPVYSCSTPAVVREGDLAPYADLIWLCTPTAAEQEWLDDDAERFAELVTDLTDPAFGSVGLLAYCSARFCAPTSDFDGLAVDRPDLADAALRLHHRGLLDLPPGARPGERHRRDPGPDDWVCLVQDWFAHALRPEDDERDASVVEALRRALPAVGYRMTRAGIRRSATTVDRVLSRSEAKAAAMVEIVDAEHRTLGDALAMLVICDHERTTSTISARLRSGAEAQDRRAGSARLALAELMADTRTQPLAPLLVTGRTVAGAPSVLADLASTVAERHHEDWARELVVGAPDADWIAELTGPPGWNSRTWVRVVTGFFAAGRCHVLVGTRALLGEGWDAPTATGLVDLGTATTATAVTQTRGRTLRLDPALPDKVAVNWTVCCVTDRHPRGDNDWWRTVRKHRGYLGVDDDGDVVDGVAHIDRAFSEFAAPAVGTFDASNAAMLVRSEQRARIRDAWRIGEPYEDVVRSVVWVAPAMARPSAVLEPVRSGPAEVMTPDGVGNLRQAVLAPDGVHRRPDAELAPPWRPGPAAASAVAALLVVVAVVLGIAGPAAYGIGAFVAGVLIAAASATAAARRRARLVLAAAQPPDPVAIGRAVADGLHAAGATGCGAEAVRWRLDALGVVRVELDAASTDATTFAEAYAEAIGAPADPRYLVPRWTLGVRVGRAWWRSLSRTRPDGVVWHAVPTALGANAAGARAYGSAWQHWIGGGDAVWTGGPEGAGALAAARDTDPLDVTAVVRLAWH